MQNRLVILSDYGLDDACAGIYLLERAHRFDGVDIVAIAGNTSAENSLRNAHKLLAAFGAERGKDALKDVRLVNTTAEQQTWTHLPSIHGKDGMGDLLPSARAPVPELPFSRWLDEPTDGFVLFSAGPCTLTRRILEKRTPAHMVLMAGVVNAQPNYDGKEFNQALDEDAYEFCLTRPHAIATLDTCRAVLCNLAGKRTAGNTLLQKLINRAEELAEARHPDNCFIYDYIAARYLVQPELFAVAPQTDSKGNKLYELCWISPRSIVVE